MWNGQPPESCPTGRTHHSSSTSQSAPTPILGTAYTSNRPPSRKRTLLDVLPPRALHPVPRTCQPVTQALLAQAFTLWGPVPTALGTGASLRPPVVGTNQNTPLPDISSVATTMALGSNRNFGNTGASAPDATNNRERHANEQHHADHPPHRKSQTATPPRPRHRGTGLDHTPRFRSSRQFLAPAEQIGLRVDAIVQHHDPHAFPGIEILVPQHDVMWPSPLTPAPPPPTTSCPRATTANSID